MRHCVAVLISLTLLAGCGEQSGDDQKSKVLARVNGEPVTQSDLEAARERTLPSVDLRTGGEKLERKLLESVVATRVMADKAEATMSDQEKADLERRVRAWREEQLVKAYLKEQIEPEPVSRAMVEDYYNKHPEHFGGGQRWHYEELSVISAGDEARRDRAVEILGKAREAEEWQAFANEQSTPEIPVEYRRGRIGADFDDKKLLERLRSLEPGEVSPLSMAGGKVNVVRVNKVETLTPRPLSEVRADIRRRLAPVKLRKAVKQVMDAAMQNADVEYVGDRGHQEQ